MQQQSRISSLDQHRDLAVVCNPRTSGKRTRRDCFAAGGKVTAYFLSAQPDEGTVQ